MADIRVNALPTLGSVAAEDILHILDASATDDVDSQTTVDAVADWIIANKSVRITGIDDVPGLRAALDGKADIVHTHTVAQVIGLQADLDAKTDVTQAQIIGRNIVLNGKSINVPSTIGGLQDDRIPNTVVVGEYLQFGTTTGGINNITGDTLKGDLNLNLVDNTADISKPVSTAQQSALDLKVDTTTYNTGQTAQDTNITTNATDIATNVSAIALNTAKVSFDSASSTKLAGIEAGADVTDTANVWGSLGISGSGSTGQVLSQRGVFVDASAFNAGLLAADNTWTGVNTFTNDIQATSITPIGNRLTVNGSFAIDDGDFAVIKDAGFSDRAIQYNTFTDDISLNATTFSLSLNDTAPNLIETSDSFEVGGITNINSNRLTVNSAIFSVNDYDGRSAIRTGLEDIVFNNSNADRDFIIRKDTTGDAFSYDAGTDTLTAGAANVVGFGGGGVADYDELTNKPIDRLVPQDTFVLSGTHSNIETTVSGVSEVSTITMLNSFNGSLGSADFEFGLDNTSPETFDPALTFTLELSSYTPVQPDGRFPLQGLTSPVFAGTDIGLADQLNTWWATLDGTTDANGITYHYDAATQRKSVTGFEWDTSLSTSLSTFWRYESSGGDREFTQVLEQLPNGWAIHNGLAIFSYDPDTADTVYTTEVDNEPFLDNVQTGTWPVGTTLDANGNITGDTDFYDSVVNRESGVTATSTVIGTDVEFVGLTTTSPSTVTFTGVLASGATIAPATFFGSVGTSGLEGIDWETDGRVLIDNQLTHVANTIAALETGITWDGNVTDNGDGTSSASLVLGTETNIDSSFTLTGGTNNTNTLVNTDGDPGGDTTIATTVTVTDSGGMEITSFTASTPDALTDNIDSIGIQIAAAVNNNTETPIDFGATWDLATKTLVFRGFTSGEAGPWSVTINNNGQTGENEGNIAVSSSISANVIANIIDILTFPDGSQMISAPNANSTATTVLGTANQIDVTTTGATAVVSLDSSIPSNIATNTTNIATNTAAIAAFSGGGAPQFYGFRIDGSNLMLDTLVSTETDTVNVSSYQDWVNQPTGITYSVVGDDLIQTI